MLTEQQFGDAITFIKDYKDALHCMEQISERRESVNHYKSFGGTVLEAMKSNQIKLTDRGLEKDESFGDFNLTKAFSYATELDEKYSLSKSTSRDDLINKFSKACEDLV